MESKILKWLNLDGVIENGKKYIDARVRLLKLEIHETITKIISNLILSLGLLFFGCMTIAFLSLALAGFLNQLLESRFLGYLIVGLIYLLCMIVLLYSKDKLRQIIYDSSAKFVENSVKENNTSSND